MTEPFFATPDAPEDRRPRSRGPEFDPARLDGVVGRRALAWVIDVIVVGIFSSLLIPLTAFIALFFFPGLVIGVSFIYRFATIATQSATPGMMIAGITLTDSRGAPLGVQEAFLHTLGYAISWAVAPLQLISIVMMMATPFRQGLTDHFLGTMALRRGLR